MKKLLGGLAILLVLPLLFTGCKKDYGPVTNRNYDFTGFSEIVIGSAFEVEVVQSTGWSIELTAQEKLFDNISVDKSNNTLEINLKWDWGTWLSNWGFQRPKARITMPDIAGLDLSGASKGNVTGFSSSEDADFLVSGASNLTLDIEAGSVKLVVSGASRIEGTIRATQMNTQIDGASKAVISGSTNNLILNVSGASNVDMEEFIAQNVDVDLSGASRATVSPEKTMRVTLSGASSLTYTGNPELEAIEISGASTIHKK